MIRAKFKLKFEKSGIYFVKLFNFIFDFEFKKIVEFVEPDYPTMGMGPA